jgi:hypothetical protein
MLKSNENGGMKKIQANLYLFWKTQSWNINEANKINSLKSNAINAVIIIRTVFIMGALL